MEKRKLGEQLVITVDKKKHLMKEVEGWENHIREVCIVNESGEVRRVFAKDLGILNEDGLLPCPFCGEYPKLTEEYDESDEIFYTVEHECSVLIEAGWWHDKQQAIDVWNKRV